MYETKSIMDYKFWNMKDYKGWCIEQHRNTNHFYDTYLPYEFHLRMVENVALEFMDEYLRTVQGDLVDAQETIIKACYGHDLIEDCRVSYNDVKKYLGQEAADIIYAVTNEKGKNRAERANDKYYKGILESDGAVFVKLCDRIANVQYSKMSRSQMFEVYKKENSNFVNKLGDFSGHHFEKIFNYLKNFFNGTH
jgi:(p)ppGpp synthase/HD superfamily hydrolase